MASVDAFQRTLRNQGCWASVRAARGDDEASACGQLATTARLTRRDADASQSTRSEGRSDGGRAVGSKIRQQTERLLHSAPKERHRCCMECQGSGVRILRKRRGASVGSGPPQVRCPICEGTGLEVVPEEEDHTVLELSPQVIKYLVALLLIELEYTHHLVAAVDTTVVDQELLITTLVAQVVVDLDT